MASSHEFRAPVASRVLDTREYIMKMIQIKHVAHDWRRLHTGRGWSGARVCLSGAPPPAREPSASEWGSRPGTASGRHTPSAIIKKAQVLIKCRFSLYVCVCTYLVTLGAEHDLPVGEPLWTEHLVHVAEVDGRLAEHVVCEHVAGGVRRFNSARLTEQTLYLQ